MRYLFVIILIFCCICPGFGRDSIYTYSITDQFERHDWIGDSVRYFVDVEGTHSIEDVIQLEKIRFTPPSNEIFPKGNFTYWACLRLENNTSSVRYDYFILPAQVDSIWVYLVKDEKVIDQQLTGSALKPRSKILSTFNNLVPYSLNPGESKTYYFKLKVLKQSPGISFTYFYVIPGQLMINQRFQRQPWQYFYAGILIFFFFLSLLMFGIFRERVFIYYAVLQFFFAAYFLNTSGFLADVSGNFWDLDQFILGILIVSGLVLSITLFIFRYIRLANYFPVYKWIVGVVAFIGIIFPHIAYLFIKDAVFIIQINNYNLLVWIVLLIIPVILRARKKDKPAKILLFSIGILTISAFFSILSLLNFIPNNALLRNSFQVGTILFSGILLYGLFDKINAIQLEKRHFKELDALKSTFFANISHEFRTPLTLIMGPLQQIIPKIEVPEDQRLLQTAQRNAQRLQRLINQLLDLSKLDAGKMQLHVSELNFAALLKGIVMSFESLAIRRSIRLHFVSENDDITLFVDRDKMEKIFYNLLSNAFKFTEDLGEVAVMVTEKKDWIDILVKDTGIGITPDRLPHIFDRFYQVDSSETRDKEGTGIGLSLVRELVQLHGGLITVESKDMEGTSFKVSFQKGKAHFKTADFEDSIQQSGLPGAVYVEVLEAESFVEEAEEVFLAETDKEQPVVLIIEDNNDVRAYIKHTLISKYQILEAVNGEEGIEKANTHLPDLVITDVMMPEKDGYEVCKSLKTDVQTSHIPVIILTAKAAQEEKLKGLEIGADDYLVKPFDSRELDVRVQNLIELRRRLRQRFAQSETIEPEAIQTNATDKAFLEKLCAILEANLSNEQFSAELFAQEAGMSRVHLNRKLKALTDLSASKFIQNFRLQQAMALLQKGAGNVSEIAFETGFSSTAYFVKCFRERYGKTPGTLLSDQ